jgi:hypothetical protein
MADCLSVCAVAVGMPAVSSPEVLRDRGIRPSAHIAAAFTSRADLPFKPPPIR